MTALQTLLALQQQSAPPIWLQLMPFAVIFAIFYFVAIAPMRRRQQALQSTIEALKKGDRVITNGGLYGEVAGVDTTTVILKIADGVKVRVAKSAIAGPQNPDAAASASDSKAVSPK